MYISVTSGVGDGTQLEPVPIAFSKTYSVLFTLLSLF